MKSTIFDEGNKYNYQFLHLKGNFWQLKTLFLSNFTIEIYYFSLYQQSHALIQALIQTNTYLNIPLLNG